MTWHTLTRLFKLNPCVFGAHNQKAMASRLADGLEGGRQNPFVPCLV